MRRSEGKKKQTERWKVCKKEEKDFVKVLVVVSREIMVVVEWGAGCHSSVPDGQAVSSQGVGVRGGG